MWWNALRSKSGVKLLLCMEKLVIIEKINQTINTELFLMLLTNLNFDLWFFCAQFLWNFVTAFNFINVLILIIFFNIIFNSWGKILPFSICWRFHCQCVSAKLSAFLSLLLFYGTKMSLRFPLLFYRRKFKFFLADTNFLKKIKRSWRI